MWGIEPCLIAEIRTFVKYVCLSGMASHPPIPTAQLPEYVGTLRANDGECFSREYESIEPGQPFTWDASTSDANKAKNRYANVVAYDHSRVTLEPLDGVDGSDYINANYMDGYCRLKAYIATQVRVFIFILILILAYCIYFSKLTISRVT